MSLHMDLLHGFWSKFYAGTTKVSFLLLREYTAMRLHVGIGKVSPAGGRMRKTYEEDEITLEPLRAPVARMW